MHVLLASTYLVSPLLRETSLQSFNLDINIVCLSKTLKFSDNKAYYVGKTDIKRAKMI